MLKVTITTPDGTFFDGESDEVIIPTQSGVIGVRSNHLPLVTLLKPGTVQAKKDGGKGQSFTVEEGYVEVGPQSVAIITHGAEKA